MALRVTILHHAHTRVVVVVVVVTAAEISLSVVTDVERSLSLPGCVRELKKSTGLKVAKLEKVENDQTETLDCRVVWMFANRQH